MGKQSNVKNIWRGIDEEFSQAFMKNELYNLYQEHKDDLIIGIRNNYLNLYYNCDSIARINYNKRNKKFSCEISTYYLGRKDGDKDRCKIEPNQICERFEVIKKLSKGRATDEKKAQSKLVLLNNLNEKSIWYCIDVEYIKQFNNKQERKDDDFYGRFDIIALSKTKPHRLAIIELKSGIKAIDGKSGIFKHIKDFHTFVEKGYFENHLQYEITEIVRSLKNLDIPVPFETPNIEDILAPEFYVITLDNRKNGEERTPRQKMAAYLFKEKEWDCTRLAEKKYCIENNYGNVTKKNNKTKSGKEFNVSFLFSEQTHENLQINDIINDYKVDDKVLPK